MKRARFQRGWLQRRKRKTGEVWLFYYREYREDGTSGQRCIKVGPTSKYPTEAEANRAVELLRIDINSKVIGHTPGPLMTIELLAKHYQLHELTDHEGDEQDEDEKASSTKDRYVAHIDGHIIPKWGSTLLTEIKSVAVRDWLRSLKNKNGEPMARSTKAKIRNIMHVLYRHASLHDFVPKGWNPISDVRQSSKREKVPEILDHEEFIALFGRLAVREQAMVLTDAATGLRRGELVGLKWGDIDWEIKQANVVRSVIHNTKRKRIGQCKTETSRKPVPLDDIILSHLSLWEQQSTYNRPEDWVWASERKKGVWPLWPQSIMVRHIKPAAKSAGITKRFNWHTFRHSFASLLRANGEDIKVVQELLRHANSRITLDLYSQAPNKAKRTAQSKVVAMFMPGARKISA